MGLLLDTYRMTTLAPGWVELPAAYAEALMAKGAGHKYIKRVPKAGGRGYRYFYHVAHGGGVHAEDHFVEGASFRHGSGHFHITEAKGDKVTVKHDETGETKTMSKRELRTMLSEHHAKALAEHHEKATKALAEAKANKASPKQIAMLEKRVAVAKPPESVRPKGEPGKTTKGTIYTKTKDAPYQSGNVQKQPDGSFYTVERVEPPRYVSASDNADFGRGAGAEYVHDVHFRPSTDAEIAHFHAFNAGREKPQRTVPPMAGWEPPKADGEPQKAPEIEKPAEVTARHHARASTLGLSIWEDKGTPKGTVLVTGKKADDHKDTRIKPAGGQWDSGKRGWVVPIKGLDAMTADKAPAMAQESTAQALPSSGPLTDVHYAAANRKGLTLAPQPGGKSVHVMGNTYPHKDTIKAAGGVWDRDKGAWKVPTENVHRILKGLSAPEWMSALASWA
jgi:hypothetical protein